MLMPKKNNKKIVKPKAVKKVVKETTARLTHKEKGFIKDVAAGKSGTEAALNNYDAKSENSAAVIASENLRKPKIIEALADAFPDELLTQTHHQLLKSSHLDNMTFPMGPKNIQEWEKLKKAAEKLVKDYENAKVDESDDDEVSKEVRTKRPLYSDYESAKKLLLETECLTDDDIKEMLSSAHCIVKKIVRIFGERRVWYWAPDNMARDKALDKAYKIKGSYAAEKRELTGLNGEPLFSDEHRAKSDKALNDLLG